MAVGMYTNGDGKKLLKLARESILEEFSEEKPDMPEEKQFRQARGVFVTLYLKGKLKGCIGFPYPDVPINLAVMKAAKSAAFSDFRFSPVKEEDMKDIKIEISILTMPEEIKNVKEIEVGKDGLMLDFVGYSGLLLPQVAVEWKMNRLEFLEALCQKAGLPDNTWQNKNCRIKKFQCQIFSEENVE